MTLPLSRIGTLALALTPAVTAQEARVETVYWDTIGPDGALTGGTIDVLVTEAAGPAPSWPAVTLTPSGFGAGNPANRVDIVYVGDGYTAGQLAAFAAHVDAIQPSFFAKEPFATYQNYFTVHRVDVVSNESGVDGDPTQDVLRDTALDMGYWCGGTERALCVNVSKALIAANSAPDRDLVCALANSSKYGGVGYPSSDLCTSAATNGAAIEIVLHEFGHALGDLADEYTYGGPVTYNGSELGPANVSIFDAAEQASMLWKWYRWLGESQPAYDGLVSTFEGGNYSENGVFRPTNNSLMRNLGRPFNLPSIEALLFKIYEEVDPIDAASSTAIVYDGSETLSVTPMQPVGHALDVQWFLDGVPIPGATGNTLELASLGLSACNEHVSVTVTDNTAWVRNEAQRAALMTQTLEFDLFVDGGTWGTYCSVTPNSTGSPALLFGEGSTSVAAADLVVFSTPVPPGSIGIFFMGNAATEIPFGNGFLCVGGGVARLGVVQGDPFGMATRQIDNDHLPPPAQVAPFQTKHLQHWYRNPAGGGAQFNLSNGVRVTFCP